MNVTLFSYVFKLAVPEVSWIVLGGGNLFPYFLQRDFILFQITSDSIPDTYEKIKGITKDQKRRKI
jgi:hypothetical protein